MHMIDFQDVLYLSCSHTYHASCLDVGGVTLGVFCPLCDKTTKPSLTHSSRTKTKEWVSQHIQRACVCVCG